MVFEKIGYFAAPVIAVVAALLMFFSKKDAGKEFLDGAKSGVTLSFELIPGMVMLVSAVKMFCASGAVDVLLGLFGKALVFLGIPSELLPLLLVRPFSGSASTALADRMFANYGPDSFSGRCASILMGASDTIVYTLALYFGAVGKKRTRYALAASFVILIFCTFVSVKLAEYLFS